MRRNGNDSLLIPEVLSEKEDDVEVVALSDCRKEFLDKAASYFPEAATYEYGMELLERNSWILYISVFQAICMQNMQ